MYFSNSNDINLWDNILDIQRTLELDDISFSQLIGLTSTEYQNFKIGKFPLKLDQVDVLCKKLNISLGHLLHGEIDLSTLRNFYLGKHDNLPKHYLQMANGNLRTFSAILNFVSSTRGEDYRKVMLRKLQLTEKMLNNPNTPVSINLYEDFTMELHKNGFQDKEFYEVGYLANRENLKQFNFDYLLNKYNKESPHKIPILIMTDLLDSNHNYNIKKIRKDYCLLSSLPKEEIKDFFHKSLIGNPYTCLIKQGAFSSIPICLGEEKGYKVKKLSCIHQGDQRCSYKIFFSN